MADTMLPFRELLKPSNKFHWDDTLQQAFEKSKLTIIDEIHNGVKIFDKTKPTCLATDWSKHGIGYWLFQKHCSCPSDDLFCCKQGWKITLVGSRFTHAAESRYAPIEGEALAVADALDKARHFVLGCKDLTIAVDHRPLLKIFGNRSLDHICNTRLRNLKEKTLRYHFKIVHIPGVKNRASDTFSRHPTGDHHPPQMVLHDDIHSIQDSTAIPPPHIPTQLRAGICTADQLHAIRMENQLQESLLSSLHSKLPHLLTTTCSSSSPPLKMAFLNSNTNCRHLSENTTNLGSIYTAVTVLSFTKIELSSHPPYDLHASACRPPGHIGHDIKGRSINLLARHHNDIQATRVNCPHCNRMAPSQAALPPTPPTLPEYPFQCICADYYYLGVDRSDKNGVYGIKSIKHKTRMNLRLVARRPML